MEKQLRLLAPALSRRLLSSFRRMARRKRSDQAHFEVERKYKITDQEFRDLPTKLRSLGFNFVGTVFMTDTFLPVVAEGDTLRIRVQTLNDRTTTLHTRKKWVEVGDERVRDEDEDEISEVAKLTLLELGEQLAGGPLPSYSKDRDVFERLAQDHNHSVEVVLDTVDHLGEYSGHYMEIEIKVQEGGDVEPAVRQIAQLAITLLGDEREFVRLSYQGMLKLTMSRQ